MQKEVVPLWRCFPAEKYTPVDIYEKLRRGESFLLESVQGCQNIAAGIHSSSASTNRYSFIGFDPYLVFKSKGYRIDIEEDRRSYSEEGNPIKKLRDLIDQFILVAGKELPPFSGGAVGYISYDTRHFFEKLPRNAVDDLKLPDMYFVFTDKVVVFDHYTKKIFLICQVRPGGYSFRDAEKELDILERWLFTEEIRAPESLLFLGDRIKSNFTRDRFMSIVRKAKEYIKCGDIYQANLSQRLSIPISGDPWNLYKILRQINPSPFASYLNFDGVKIVSSSPERLLLVRGEDVETRPIAGTRPRGKNMSEYKRFSRGLILSPKERAEHIMLVDLERNDLGRVCRYGTVEVNELMTLERYSHVIHIVSNVRGRLRPGMDRFNALAACFPGGTITGTPKIRSMEIIDELEGIARSVYTGSIGYLNYGGEMDLNIVIRTFVICDGAAYIQVGAGIVADSNPEREYYETLHKAEALITAIRKAKAGKCHMP